MSGSDLSRYGYDPRSLRYRDLVNGQYVASAQVRAAIDSVINAETVKVRGLAESLLAGKLSLADWQVQMAAQLKQLYVAAGIVANGGIASMSQADYGYLGSLIKKQYQYLQNFASEIASGKQPLDGTLAARAALYTEAARALYEDARGRAAQLAGLDLERSVLGIADHCSGCLDAADQGWQPIGTVTPIGERNCLARCHCTMEYGVSRGDGSGGDGGGDVTITDTED